jgi:hypothetical protein
VEVITDIISETWKRIGFTWSLKDTDARLQPSSKDVEQTLDEAVRVLYTSEVGARFEGGGLIVEKRPRGHEVYVFVGTYQ